MKWLMVGKTVVSFGSGTPMYVLINEADTSKPVRRFLTLAELALAVLKTKPNPLDEEVRFVKNDVPAVVWLPDDTVQDRFLECERLDKDVLRELARLLRS